MSRRGGGTTGGGGTPVPVDVSTTRRSKATIAQLVAGPVVWSVHFMLVYLVVEAGCTGSGPGLAAFGPPVPKVATLALTAVATLACLGTALWSHRMWRAGRRPRPELADPDPDGALAFAGLLLSLLGVVAVLFVGLPALVLTACA